MNWNIDAWADRVAIHSDSMPTDAAIELVGDFGSQAERMKFAEMICMAMNSQEQTKQKPKRVAEMA
jgi:hypothetical protein